jgi:nucleotide-binding universal stress UspA family protein
MAMYKKILVPIDGSPTSKRGLGEAIRLAKHHKAKMRLIHVVNEFVVTPTLESGRYVDDIQQSFREDGRRLLKKAEGLVRKHGLTVDSVMFEVVGVHAAGIIVAQAKKWRADIIVIGTHGRRGVLRLVMGSDAEEVVRTSPVPVLLVRPKRSGH